MLGAGTVINPIIKIVTTIIVLGAVYLFIVKPVLDTTNEAFDQFGGAFEGLPADFQEQVEGAFDEVDDDDTRKRLERCIKDAGTNTRRINRCVERFTG
jgi:hypothetical protein